MTMPQDPSQDTTFTGLDQQAINDSLDAYNQAAIQYTDAGQKFTTAQAAQNDAQGTASQSGADSAFAAASSQLDSARTALGAASRSHANLLAKFAVAAQAKTRTSTDPAQQALWTNEADKANSQSALYNDEADMYQAKTQSAIDAASARSTSDLSRAASVASRVTSQNDQSAAAAALSSARAASIPALTASTVALHQAQIQLASSRSTQALSSANVNDARAAYISGPQAQQAVARGDLTQAQADFIVKSGGAKLGDLIDKGLLDQTRAQQIVLNMSKWTVLPYNDRSNPTLVQQQASTGAVAGVPNPGYVNPMLQPQLDRAAAIQGIQQQLASGAFGTGPAAVQQANALMDGINQQSQLAAQGYTPEQYQSAQAQQAQQGQKTLTDMVGQGNTMASSLMDAASKSTQSFGPTTPYENAINMMGGPQAQQQAIALIQQVKPISSRMDAADAAAKYSQAAALFRQAAGQPGGSQSPTTPALANTQAAQSPIAASQAAQAQTTLQGNASGVGGNGVGVSTTPFQAQGAPSAISPQAMALLAGAGA